MSVAPDILIGNHRFFGVPFPVRSLRTEIESAVAQKAFHQRHISFEFRRFGAVGRLFARFFRRFGRFGNRNVGAFGDIRRFFNGRAFNVVCGRTKIRRRNAPRGRLTYGRKTCGLRDASGRSRCVHRGNNHSCGSRAESVNGFRRVKLVEFFVADVCRRAAVRAAVRGLIVTSRKSERECDCQR